MRTSIAVAMVLLASASAAPVVAQYSSPGEGADDNFGFDGNTPRIGQSRVRRLDPSLARSARSLVRRLGQDGSGTRSKSPYTLDVLIANRERPR